MYCTNKQSSTMKPNYINFYVLILIILIQVVKNSEVENQSGHDIIDGNCVNSVDKDRVYYDHVYKTAIPLFIRSETEKIYVDNTIYCVIAQNQKSNETGGTAEITAGGVGQKYVYIQLESYRSEGLDFYVVGPAELTNSVRGRCGYVIVIINIPTSKNCSLRKPFLVDLLWIEEEYSGNSTIYCIQAINQKSVETGGNAYITKGGVNLTYVTIELESFRSHGLEYYVSIYAKNGTRAKTPMSLDLAHP